MLQMNSLTKNILWHISKEIYSQNSFMFRRTNLFCILKEFGQHDLSVFAKSAFGRQIQVFSEMSEHECSSFQWNPVAKHSVFQRSKLTKHSICQNGSS